MCHSVSFNATNDVHAMFESLLCGFGIVFGFSAAPRPPVTLQQLQRGVVGGARTSPCAAPLTSGCNTHVQRARHAATSRRR